MCLITDHHKAKATELKEDMDRSTNTVGDFNIPLSVMDRIARPSKRGNKGL